MHDRTSGISAKKIVGADIVMADIRVAYIVMAYTVMAIRQGRHCEKGQGPKATACMTEPPGFLQKKRLLEPI